MICSAIKFEIKQIIQWKMKQSVNWVLCYVVVVQSCLRCHFARSVLDRWLESQENWQVTQHPAVDLVLFKLELMPNQWNSLLKNTSIQSIRDVPITLPNLSFIFLKFTENGDPEIHNKAFSTWSVQETRPKELEAFESIWICQSVQRNRGSSQWLCCTDW